MAEIVESNDIKVLADRLCNAKAFVDDYQKRLMEAEPKKYGIYRDAVGKLWIHQNKHLWQLILPDSDCCKLAECYGWEKFVINVDRLKGIFPFTFVAPIVEDKEED